MTLHCFAFLSNFVCACERVFVQSKEIYAEQERNWTAFAFKYAIATESAQAMCLCALRMLEKRIRFVNTAKSMEQIKIRRQRSNGSKISNNRDRMFVRIVWLCFFFFNWCYALLNGFVFNYDMPCYWLTLLDNPFGCSCLRWRFFFPSSLCSPFFYF